MQFQVGDKAVYPAHGVTLIKGIETVEMEGIKLTLYILKVLHDGSTIKVPIQKAQAIGLRAVIPLDRIDQIYEILRDRVSPTDNQTWNRRYREYMAKIKTGDPLEVAKVLRDLALMKNDKNLSFGERKMYDQARNLLVQEIAESRDVDEATVSGELDTIFQPDGPPKAPPPVVDLDDADFED